MQIDQVDKIGKSHIKRLCIAKVPIRQQPIVARPNQELVKSPLPSSASRIAVPQIFLRAVVDGFPFLPGWDLSTKDQRRPA